jgi:hypothetical protein
VTQAFYYTGRLGQLVGMWLLLVDIFMAGPLGPSPRLFAIGIGAFVAGWGLVKLSRKR